MSMDDTVDVSHSHESDDVSNSDESGDVSNSDESDDVSSTYVSDEEMDCTCILTQKDEAGQDVTDSTQESGGGDTNYFSAEDKQELNQVDFHSKPGTAHVFPRNFRKSLSKEIRQRLDFFASQRTTVALVVPSSRLPGFSKTQSPEGFVYDMIVISPSGSTFILTITNTADVKANSRVYNTSLARALTTFIREKVLGRFKAAHGVLSTSDLTSDDNFKKKLQSLEDEASLTSIQHTLCLSHDKCQVVLSTVVSLLEGSSGTPTPHLTSPQKQEQSISGFATEDWKKQYPRQLLNVTEARLLKQRETSGILMLPTSMHDHIKTHRPVILDHIHQHMGTGGGWVLAQTSLLDILGTSSFIPPNLFCDVIIMTSYMPIKVLTFATLDDGSQDVYSYNDNLAQMIQGTAGDKEHGGHVKKEVIFVDDKTDEMSCIKTTAEGQGRLLNQPLCDLYDKITNSLLNMILSQHNVLHQLNHEQGVRTGGDTETYPVTLCSTRQLPQPRIKSVLTWNLNGGVPSLSGVKVTYEWSFGNSSCQFKEDESIVGDEGMVSQFGQNTQTLIVPLQPFTDACFEIKALCAPVCG